MKWRKQPSPKLQEGWRHRTTELRPGHGQGPAQLGLQAGAEEWPSDVWETTHRACLRSHPFHRMLSFPHSFPLLFFFLPSSFSKLYLIRILGLGSPCSSLSLPGAAWAPEGLGWDFCPAQGICCPGDTSEGQKTKPQAWLKTVFPPSKGKEKIKKGVGNAMQNRKDLKKTSHNVTRFLCGRNEHWQNSHVWREFNWKIKQKSRLRGPKAKDTML